MQETCQRCSMWAQYQALVPSYLTQGTDYESTPGLSGPTVYPRPKSRPTRLETRTKESNMYASPDGVYPEGRN